jgi:diguanylate cyclase
VTALAVVSAALMTAVAFVSGAVLASPPTLILPLLMLLSVTLLSTAIRRASIEHLHISTVDALTGALTRVSLDMRTTELAEQTAVTGEPVALVAVDVDDFKLVNDLYGHQSGDRVLVALAGLLRAHGQAYRLGGDEFVVLLPGLTATEAAVTGEGRDAVRIAASGLAIA